MINATRIDVVREAWSWLGTPWRDRARVISEGVDCAQYPAAVFEAVGVIPHIEPKYDRQWALNHSEELYVRWVLQFAREIQPEERDAGDMAVWKYGRAFSHGGILIGKNQVLHAVLGVGVTMDETDRQEHLRTYPVRYFTVWGGDNG